LLGGGDGTRFGGDKIFADFLGRPVFWHSFSLFEKCAAIDGIIVVGSTKNHKMLERESRAFSKISTVIFGGKNRFESAKTGFLAAKKRRPDLVIFHNLANPLADEKTLQKVISAAEKSGASAAARKVSSTIRRADGAEIDREDLWEMETPQAVKPEFFAAGLKKIARATDDLAVAIAGDASPIFVETPPQNRKITTTADRDFLEKAAGHFSIGIGADAHDFGDAPPLVFGGKTFPAEKKLLGNSDGDALFHALSDAILSGIGEKSFSTFADEKCRGGEKNSAVFLKMAVEKMREKRRKIQNISIVIFAKSPKFEPHFPEIKKNIAKICEVAPTQIGLTAKSGNGLFSGGVAVHARVLFL